MGLFKGPATCPCQSAWARGGELWLLVSVGGGGAEVGGVGGTPRELRLFLSFCWKRRASTSKAVPVPFQLRCHSLLPAERPGPHNRGAEARQTDARTDDRGRPGRWTPLPPPSPCCLHLEDEPSLQGHGRGAPRQGHPAGALCPPGRGALVRAPLQRDDPVQAPGPEGAPVLRDPPCGDAQIHSPVQR